VSDEPLGDLLADRRVRLTWQAANHGDPEAMLRDGSSVAGRTAWLPVSAITIESPKAITRNSPP
jgi:hypothetical protein